MFFKNGYYHSLAYTEVMLNITHKTKIIPAKYNHSLYNHRKYLILSVELGQITYRSQT